MNWYIKQIFAQLTGLQNYLGNLQTDPDIMQYILSLDKDSAQFLTNEVRKNPTLTLNQIQSIQLPQKTDPYLPSEKRLAKNFELELPQFSQWILVSSRKLRKGALPSISNESDGGVNDVRWLAKSIGEGGALAYQSFLSSIPEIRDWVVHINPEIASYSAEQAMQASDEWHQMMAGKGEGKNYETTKEDLIMYGPEWTNQKSNGWTIQKVLSENDLLAEGNKMSHCVGAYCNDIQSGNSIIYSLRDPGNNPKVTMEANNYNEMVQIQGHSNSEPDTTYKAMIKEWLTGNKNPGIKSFEEGEDPLGEISYTYDTSDSLVDAIYLLGSDDYGIRRQTSYDPKDMAQMAIEMEERTRDPSYHGGITNIPEAIVDFAINTYGENPETLMNKLNELESYAQKLEEEIYDFAYSHWDMSWFERPNEEDFETKEEFAKAEEKRMEEEGNYISEEIQKTPRGGLASDIFKQIRKLREKKIIPEYSHNPKLTTSFNSGNWYKKAQINNGKVKYGPDGSFFILCKNTKLNEGPWRISYFNTEGKGYVHKDFETYEEAETVFNYTYGTLKPPLEKKYELV